MLLGHPVLLEGEKSGIHKQPRHMGVQGVFAHLINLKQPPDTWVYRVSRLCTSELPEVLLNHLLDTQWPVAIREQQGRKDDNDFKPGERHNIPIHRQARQCAAIVLTSQLS